MADPTQDASRQAAFSRALKVLRRRRGRTALEVARALGIPKRTYDHFEAGKAKINLDRVHAVARVLNADPHALLAAAEIASPEFAVRCADNKLMTILMMALSEFDAEAADQMIQLDPRTLMSAFKQSLDDLTAVARDRAGLAGRWTPPEEDGDPDDDGA